MVTKISKQFQANMTNIVREKGNQSINILKTQNNCIIYKSIKTWATFIKTRCRGTKIQETSGLISF